MPLRLTMSGRCTLRHGRAIRTGTRQMEAAAAKAVSRLCQLSWRNQANEGYSVRPTDISDVTINNLQADGLRGGAFTISQCTRFKGAPGDGNCTNSGFEVRDMTLTGLTGTSRSDNVASLQCSAVKPCTSIGLFDVDLRKVDDDGAGTDAPVKEYLCGNAVDVRGFECTGEACEGGSSTGECNT